MTYRMGSQIQSVCLYQTENIAFPLRNLLIGEGALMPVVVLVFVWV